MGPILEWNISLFSFFPSTLCSKDGFRVLTCKWNPLCLFKGTLHSICSLICVSCVLILVTEVWKKGWYRQQRTRPEKNPADSECDQNRRWEWWVWKAADGSYSWSFQGQRGNYSCNQGSLASFWKGILLFSHLTDNEHFSALLHCFSYSNKSHCVTYWLQFFHRLLNLLRV